MPSELVARKQAMSPVARALIALFCSALGWSRPAAAASARAKAVECLESKAIIRAAVSSVALGTDIIRAAPLPLPMVGEDGPGGKMMMVPLSERSVFWRAGWKGRIPSSQLIHRWFVAIGQPSDNCPISQKSNRTVTALLGQMSHQDFDRSKRLRLDPGEFAISKPAISGDTALILYALTEHALGGVTELILLEKTAGKWEIVGRRVLTIS
jgi:hypothetical protein